MARRNTVTVSESNAMQAGAELQTIIDGGRYTTTVTTSGSVNDFEPGSADIWRRSTWVKFDPAAADLTINSLVAPSGSDAPLRKVLINISSTKYVFLVDESTGTAANRINHELTVNVRLPPVGGTGSWAVIEYDTTIQRWRVVFLSHDSLMHTQAGAIVYRDTAGEMSEVLLANNVVFGSINEGAGGIALGGYQAIAACYRELATTAIQTITQAAALAYAVNLGLDAKVTLNQAHTSLTWSGMLAGDRGRLKLIQDGTGSRTISSYVVSGGSVLFPGGPPTLSTAASAVDIFDWTYDGTDILVVPSLALSST